MSLGLQVIAAAANHRPIDIKKLVEAALFDRASAVLTEGYKIVAAEQYGGLDEVSKYQKDPEVTSYRSGKGKTPAKLDRDYGDGMTSSSNMRQRNTRLLKRYPDGISNKREMKAIVKRNKTKADYHSKSSHKRFMDQ